MKQRVKKITVCDYQPQNPGPMPEPRKKFLEFRAKRKYETRIYYQFEKGGKKAFKHRGKFFRKRKRLH